jgi:hypothetical protein
MSDGRVMIVPHSGANVGIFNPTTNSYSSTAIGQVPASSYQGGCLLPDGRVYCGTGNSTHLGIFNPITSNFSTILSGTFPGAGAYNGFIVTPYGRIILITNSGTTVGVISGLAPISPDFCLHPFFNKI